MVLYDISLADRSKLTIDFLDKMKLLAYLVYDALVEYEYDCGKDILYKDNIIFNELSDDFRNHITKYEFIHTDYNRGMYEPFMISDASFGFTIYSNSIAKEEIIRIISEEQKNIGFDVVLNINYFVLRNNRDRLETIAAFYPSLKARAKRRFKHA